MQSGYRRHEQVSMIESCFHVCISMDHYRSVQNHARSELRSISRTKLWQIVLVHTGFY